MLNVLEQFLVVSANLEDLKAILLNRVLYMLDILNYSMEFMKLIWMPQFLLELGLELQQKL